MAQELLNTYYVELKLYNQYFGFEGGRLIAFGSNIACCQDMILFYLLPWCSKVMKYLLRW